MQTIESSRAAFLPRCQQRAASTMTASNNAEPRRVFYCGLCCASAFDLNQDDLQSIAAFQSIVLAVILADGNEIDNAARFASALAIEFDEMPARIWLVFESAANRNLRHRHCPAGVNAGKSKAPFIFGGGV